MASLSDIFDVRIAVNDPDVITIIEIANSSLLPAAPTPQTAYYTTDSGYYYITDKTSGAVESDYEFAELNISDTRLGTIIDNVGAELAKCRVLSVIAGMLGNQLRLIRTTSGSENSEYNRILDMYNYYKALSNDCKDQYKSDNYNNSGKMYQMKQPEIGGGNL